MTSPAIDLGVATDLAEAEVLERIATGRDSGYLAWEVAYLLASADPSGGWTVSDVFSYLTDLTMRGLVTTVRADNAAATAVHRYAITVAGRRELAEMRVIDLRS